MFEGLYDSVSMIFSHWWPETRGEITAVDVETRYTRSGGSAVRLAIAYKFNVEQDGPYTGESFLPFSTSENVAAARDRLRLHESVRVRYRRDDPSVNRLDHEVWRDSQEES